jgi:hypothetical protein
MKKNKMMRIASILLVVTLLSTCVISGTFAKYVTKAEGSDQARVAKWGIIVGVEGDSAFKTQYETDDQNGYEGEFSVVANESINLLDMDEPEHVVAPGTKGNGLKGTVVGTPEVATRYTLTISNWEDIVLPKATDTYIDYTNYVLNEGYTGKFDLNYDYSPIKWDITVSNGSKTISLLGAAAEKLGTTVDELHNQGVYGFSAAEAKEIMKNYAGALEGLLADMAPTGASNPHVEVKDDGTIELSMDFDPNIPVDYTFELNWMWNFEGPMKGMTSPSNIYTFDAETVDMADTYLGNWIAKLAGQDVPNFVDPTDGSYIIRANVTATATQID